MSIRSFVSTPFCAHKVLSAHENSKTREQVLSTPFCAQKALIKPFFSENPKNPKKKFSKFFEIFVIPFHLSLNIFAKEENIGKKKQ